MQHGFPPTMNLPTRRAYTCASPLKRKQRGRRPSLCGFFRIRSVYAAVSRNFSLIQMTTFTLRCHPHHSTVQNAFLHPSQRSNALQRQTATAAAAPTAIKTNRWPHLRERGGGACPACQRRQQCDLPEKVSRPPPSGGPAAGIKHAPPA